MNKILKLDDLFAPNLDGFAFAKFEKAHPEEAKELEGILASIRQGSEQTQEMCRLRPEYAEKFTAQHNKRTRELMGRAIKLADLKACWTCGRRFLYEHITYFYCDGCWEDKRAVMSR